jgi:hypothetical protein
MASLLQDSKIGQQIRRHRSFRDPLWLAYALDGQMCQSASPFDLLLPYASIFLPEESHVDSFSHGQPIPLNGHSRSNAQRGLDCLTAPEYRAYGFHLNVCFVTPFT